MFEEFLEKVCKSSEASFLLESEEITKMLRKMKDEYEMKSPEAQAMPDHVWVLENTDENIPCEFVADRLRQIFTRQDQAEHFTRTSTITAQIKAADEMQHVLNEVINALPIAGNNCYPGIVERAKRAIANYASVRKESK